MKQISEIIDFVILFTTEHPYLSIIIVIVLLFLLWVFYEYKTAPLMNDPYDN